MLDTNQNNGSNAQSQVNAIRDILFGKDMQQYDERFGQLRDMVSTLRTETNVELSQLNEQLLTAINSLEERLRNQIQQNHTELLTAIQDLQQSKVDKTHLGNLLIEMGNQFKQ